MLVYKRRTLAGVAPQSRRQIKPMIWLARIFTWWNGQTINTALQTLLFGKFAGKERIRQSLLPDPEDRQGAGLRAPLGDLRGLRARAR
jgi:hypothetical protein